MPAGYFLKWTGQYEQLAQMLQRMKIVVPVTLLIIALLLFLQFRNFVEVLIILLSIPFALIGSVWLMWLLDYRLSTAVWVGIIALVGLAAQTGIVMIVYIDHAFQRRKAAGLIRNLDDIVAAHMEGTVQRVRPKLMTVSTMLIGLVPLLWAQSSGADVMKRIAAPMVGRPADLGVPDAGDHPGRRHVLAPRAAALGAAGRHRSRAAPAPEDRRRHRRHRRDARGRPGRGQHLPHVPRPQPRARRAPRGVRLPRRPRRLPHSPPRGPPARLAGRRARDRSYRCPPGPR